MNIVAVFNSMRKHGIVKTIKTVIIRKKRLNQQKNVELQIEEALALMKTEADNSDEHIQDSYNHIVSILSNNKDVTVSEKILRACLLITTQIARDKEDLDNSYIFLSCKPFVEIISHNKKIISRSDVLKRLTNEVRERLKDIEKKPRYVKYVKAKYVKEIYPAIYESESVYPIEKKIIVMENDSSPSPTSRVVGEAIKAQGKYTVKYTGLKRRKVPEIEYFENGAVFIKDFATAYALILTSANDLLSFFDVREETKIIQLWHGVGMFKKCGYSRIDESKRSKKVYNSYRNYTYVTIASEEQRWTFEESMNLPKGTDIIKPIGIARTDVLYDKSHRKEVLDILYKLYPGINGRKVILYAPTFRGIVADAKAPDKLDLFSMSQLSDKYVLIIKHHGLVREYPSIPSELLGSFAFDLSKSKELGIDDLLAISDICITDYSSIAFEFAIMERPIIFFAYDKDDYIDKRGLYYGYEDITPGPIVKTTKEIVDYIRNINEMYDPKQVRDFRLKYVDACDGRALERTINLLDI